MIKLDKEGLLKFRTARCGTALNRGKLQTHENNVQLGDFLKDRLQRVFYLIFVAS